LSIKKNAQSHSVLPPAVGASRMQCRLSRIGEMAASWVARSDGQPKELTM
jgi:hypothetical protein